MTMISSKDLAIGYDKNLVVKDVTFEINQGDYLCIVGENGSGKSTLMKGILGLIKQTSGHIVFQDLKQTEIGYLPQQTQIQKDFPAKVFEVVLSGCINHKGLMPFFTKKDKERAEYNISRLGMKELKNKSYRYLSGGQQQRVLLARALCATERLLLLDEPVTGLDPIMASEMYALIKQLNQEQNITIIMITHDVKSAVQYGNKILHMDTTPIFFGLIKDYVETSIGKKMLGGDNCD